MINQALKEFEAAARLSGFTNFARERGRYCHIDLQRLYEGFALGRKRQPGFCDCVQGRLPCSCMARDGGNQTRNQWLDIVFAGSMPDLTFVEVEDMRGESVKAGKWLDRGDGYQVLRIGMEPPRVGRWVPFSERWPEQNAALDDPAVKTMPSVLVTNNFEARDRMGRMSHVWYGAPMKSGDGQIITFTESDSRIYGLTHWFEVDLLAQPEVNPWQQAAERGIREAPLLSDGIHPTPEAARAIAAQVDAERLLEKAYAAQSAPVVPECVQAWYDAKLAHVEAVDAYNARLEFIRQHMPFGTAADPEYQIMTEAENKERELRRNLFSGLREWFAAPEPAAQSIMCHGCFAQGVEPDHFDAAGKCKAMQPAALQEHCAEIIEGWRIVFAGAGPILPIVERHGLKIGSKLYARPLAAAQEPFELRLCEQDHTVLQPGRLNLFTVDQECPKCLAIASGARQERGAESASTGPEVKPCS